MTIQEKITELNKTVPPDTIPIQYKKQGEVKSSKVRFTAEILASGRAVIWLRGELEAIDLNDLVYEYSGDKKNKTKKK